MPVGRLAPVYIFEWKAYLLIGVREEVGRKTGNTGCCYLGASPTQPSGYTVTNPLLPLRFTAWTGVPPPVQYASSFRVQRPKLVSSCLAVKSEQSNFSALHTNHEGSLLHSREHLSCAFIPYQNWMTQNMVLNFVKAPLRVIEGQVLARPYQWWRGLV